MLHTSEKQEAKLSSMEHAVKNLTDESSLNIMSYNRYLRLAAQEEKVALSLVSDIGVQSVADGLALSILGSIHGSVALKILSTPVLRKKLLGIDLEKLASSSKEAAMTILTSLDLKGKLKTYDIAVIGTAHPDLVDTIIDDLSLLGRIEYIHYGQLCKNNINAAKQMISEKSIYMEGVEIALIAKHHPDVSLSLIANKGLRHKIDTESLVILSTASESVAIAILKDSGFYEQLGPIGISRMLANYSELAHSFIDKNPKILYEFDKISTACIVEKSPSIALQLYKNDEYKSRTKIDKSHVAWIENAVGLEIKAYAFEMAIPNKALLRTFEKLCVSFMLKNQIDFPSNAKGGILKGIFAPLLIKMEPDARKQIVHQLVEQVRRMEIDELTALGNKSEDVARDVLQHYQNRLLGEDLVLLGENHLSIVRTILKTPELCGRLSGFNLVMMCKSHPEACRDIFSDKVLREKIVGCHAGVLALKDHKMLHLIFGDEEIKSNLTQKDLPLLCKRYIGVTKQALAEQALYNKFSKFYHELLQTRIDTVGAISSLVRRFFISESQSVSSSSEDIKQTKSGGTLLMSYAGQLDDSISGLSLQDNQKETHLKGQKYH